MKVTHSTQASFDKEVRRWRIAHTRAYKPNWFERIFLRKKADVKKWVFESETYSITDDTGHWRDIETGRTVGEILGKYWDWAWKGDGVEAARIFCSKAKAAEFLGYSKRI